MLNEPFGRLKEDDVHEAVINGEIIEHYPSDKPYPSLLILGRTGNGRNVHVVCAYAEDENLSIVITVYQPDPELWIESRERRLNSYQITDFI
jgi:hypothetical protein